MANDQNLRPGEYKLSKEEAKRGGIASGIARRRKATMLSTLEMLLDETNPKAGKTYRELATLGLIKGAVNGSSKNYEVISNLIAEKEKKEEMESAIVCIPAKDLASH